MVPGGLRQAFFWCSQGLEGAARCPSAALYLTTPLAPLLQERYRDARCRMEQWMIPLLTSLISVSGALVSVVYGRRCMRSERLDVADQLAVRFREPLLLAVFNLETRIYNIVELGFFARFLAPDSSEEDREYAVLNTLYVVGQFFCWCEILRRDSQFVDPRNDERNCAVMRTLEAVRETFTDSITANEQCFRLFRGEQRALGEVMLVPAVDPHPGAPRWECMGYAAFLRALDDPQNGRWFVRLRAHIEVLAQDVRGHDVRLRLLQNRLIDILDVVDPEGRRIPVGLRKRVSPTASPPAQHEHQMARG
jgi:hypothetical protein